MQMSENNRFFSFVLDLAHVKSGLKLTLGQLGNDLEIKRMTENSLEIVTSFSKLSFVIFSLHFFFLICLSLHHRRKFLTMSSILHKTRKF